MSVATILETREMAVQGQSAIESIIEGRANALRMASTWPAMRTAATSTSMSSGSFPSRFISPLATQAPQFLAVELLSGAPQSAPLDDGLPDRAEKVARLEEDEPMTRHEPVDKTEVAGPAIFQLRAETRLGPETRCFSRACRNGRIR